ncbi:MAG: hypothetical protein C4530_07785 [Desulfobacteraceae bacterium]|nr:MAG: hypothetical protein C4530_07785 [Desulfobacteraceae bacterium]
MPGFFDPGTCKTIDFERSRFSVQSCDDAEAASLTEKALNCLEFWIFNFEFVSDFGFRYSDLNEVFIQETPERSHSRNRIRGKRGIPGPCRKQEPGNHFFLIMSLPR